MENVIYKGYIKNDIKPFEKISITLESENHDQINACVTVKEDTLPIVLNDNQTGIAKKADSLENMIKHLKQKIEITSDEEESFNRLIREKMYYKVAYFVKLLYNVNSEKITYDDLCNLFYFDDFLRMSLNRLLPSIEQFAKATLNSYLLEEYADSQIYRNDILYKTSSDKDKVRFDRTLSTCIYSIKKSKNEGVIHHKTYHGGYIPIWMFFDNLTFGQFNMLVTCMERKVLDAWLLYMKINSNDAIEQLPFNIAGKSLPSHLQTIQILRNTTVHISRIYGKIFNYNPSILKLNDDYWASLELSKDAKPKETQIHSFFTGLVSASFFYSCMSVDEIRKWNKFLDKLENKMNEINFLNKEGYMGFPKNWKEILFIKVQ